MSTPIKDLINTAISSEKSYEITVGKIVQLAKQNEKTKDYQKNIIKEIEKWIKKPKDLKSSKESPLKFFYALQIMKEIIDSGNHTFSTALNNSEKLLQILGEVGKVDAKLKIDQKGKSLFDSKRDPDGIGQIYIQLVLECIIDWKVKYPKDATKKPTNFANTYQTLIDNKVVLPKDEEFVFFIPKQKQPKASPPPVQNHSQHPKEENKPTPGVNVKDQIENLRNKLRVTMDTVKELIIILQDTVLINDEPSDFLYESIIQTTQELTQKDKELKLLIQESYNVPNVFSEEEFEEIFFKASFLSDLLEHLNKLVSNYDISTFKNFVKYANNEIEKTYGIPAPKKYVPEPEPVRPMKISIQKPDHKIEISSAGKKKYEDPSHIPDNFGTFGGSEIKEEDPFNDFHGGIESSHQLKDKYKNRDTDEKIEKRQVDEYEYKEEIIKSKIIENEYRKNSNSPGIKLNKMNMEISSKNQAKNNDSNAFIHSPREEKQNRKESVPSEYHFKKNEDIYHEHNSPSFQPYNFQKNDAIHETSKPNRDNHEKYHDNTNSNEYSKPIYESTKPIIKDVYTSLKDLSSQRQNDVYRNDTQKKIEFDEKFDNLSVSTLSIRDFPLKNKVLKDPKQKTPGRLVPYNESLFDLEYLFTSNNLSNLRKFKISCLKNKSPLYEIPNLQIGIISSIFFDIVSSKNYIKLSIFYGNKSRNKLEDFRVDYTGDYTMSIWLKNDEEFNSNQNYINPRSQLKHELLINYNAVPYIIVLGEIEIRNIEDNLSFPIYLPLLITKFFNMKDCEPSVFKYKWKIKKEYRLRTNIFSINPKIIRHPSYIKRYFPKICDLTNIKDFISQTKDSEYFEYKTGLVFELNKPEIDYLIKITLLPNMTMYVQIASSPNFANVCEYILQTFYFLFMK